MLLARYFVADNILEEITFGLPRQKGELQLKKHLASNIQRAFNWAWMLVEFLSTCVMARKLSSHISIVFSGY